MIVKRLNIFSDKLNGLPNVEIISPKGDKVELEKRPISWLGKFFRKISSSMRNMQDKSHNYIIKVDGRNVGFIDLFETNEEDLDIREIEITSSSRGQGYAQKVLLSLIEFARAQGFKRLTLQAVQSSPSAVHIYKKLGFVEGKVLSTAEDDFYYGGLVEMTLVL